MSKPKKPRQARPGSNLTAPIPPAAMAAPPAAPEQVSAPPLEAAPAVETPPVSASPQPAPVAAVAALPPQSPPSYRDWAALGRDNFSAMLKANGAVTEGLEAISKEMIGYAHKSLEQAARAATALMHAKNLDEIIHLNSAFTASSIESLLARSASMSDLGFRLASEALVPLTSRVEANLATLTRPLAL